MVSSKKFEMVAITNRFFNRTCAYCGSELNESTITADHFIPKSAGGKDNFQNIVPSCSKCNQSKSNKHPWRWYIKQPFFNFERWTNILCYLRLNHFKVKAKK